MKMEEAKSAIALEKKVKYKGQIYAVKSVICSIINRQWEYSVELVENYFEKDKAKCVLRARMKDVEVVE